MTGRLPLPAVVELIVPADAAGQRLDRFLAALADEDEGDARVLTLSRARLQKLIVAGEITLDGRRVKRAATLRGGESVRVALPEPAPTALVPEPMALEILYEDDDVIAVAKPAGLVVHPGAGHARGTLVHGLLAHCRFLSGVGGVERPGIVHRLDRDTSGVVIVAKNDRAHHGLAGQFAARTVRKRYLAFVLGEPAPREATIDTLYGRHPTVRTRFTGRARQGKRAITRYRVVASRDGVSRLEVEIATGRTHQIRVHLSERGHPVLLDPEYGGRDLRRISDVALREVAHRVGRQALHAARLELDHPVSGAPLCLVAPVPAELALLAAVLPLA
jgi:23S rRNA pseudouridine1911/1915/1917 synthase